MNRKVPEQLESLAKMLIRGTYKQIASATWRSPIFKERTSASCSKRHRSIVKCRMNVLSINKKESLHVLLYKIYILYSLKPF